MAAFVNGSAIRCLDFNDDYFGTEHTNAHGDTGPHPSDNLGGVLAAAQIAGASGADTLLGIAIAYEVCGQLVDEVVLRGNGWDHPTFHSIATCGGRLADAGSGRRPHGRRAAPGRGAEHLSVRDPRRRHLQLEGPRRAERQPQRSLRCPPGRGGYHRPRDVRSKAPAGS